MIGCAILMIVAAQYRYYTQMIGPAILISWGAAAAIHGLNFVSVLLVSYSFLTRCWWVCKTRCSFMIDQKIFFHWFCGYAILIFSIIHTIGHLGGSFVKMSQASLEEINSDLMYKRFK